MKGKASKSKELSGRVIMVTGAGRGIGAAVAKSLASHGATVILVGRRVAGLEAVYDAIKAAGGPEPAIAPLNLELMNSQECDSLINNIGKEFGKLDGLLHNATHLAGLTPLSHYSPQEWYKTLQINLNSPFLLTLACLPLLAAAPDASILFTGDAVGRHGKAYYGAYGVSKFAAEGLMQTLAEETQANTSIRVNSLDPGTVRTDLFKRIYPGRLDDVIPSPEDIVHPYLFLLGPASRGITGQSFRAQENGPWSKA